MSGRHVSTQQVILRPSKKTDPKGIYVRETCFDLAGHPQALQENRSKRYICQGDMFRLRSSSGLPRKQIQKIYMSGRHVSTYLRPSKKTDPKGIYFRATWFELVGHPQSLQEHRSKRCLVFSLEKLNNVTRWDPKLCIPSCDAIDKNRSEDVYSIVETCSLIITLSNKVVVLTYTI